MTEKFGLIGKTLKHSYSKIIHEKLGDYPYDLYEIDPTNLKDFLTNSELKGFNVTIPYKKDVIPYLDVVDESAKVIGAVNTVVKRDGKLYGYNTDFNGMLYMLSEAGITLKDKKVMILGTGGTGNTARAVCEYSGAKEIIVVSRSGAVNYENYKEYKGTEVIINTTPVGMYPDIDACPIDLKDFNCLLGVADVIYNPSKTKLLYQAEKLKIKNTNGLPMLVAQAKYAMEHFLDKKVSDSAIKDIIFNIESETKNVVLIGMPGSGKSSIGKRVAEILDREFIDTDQEIIKRENRSIPEIFASNGEEYFRNVETEVLKDVCKKSGKIIATGGGVVKLERNEFVLRCNSAVICVSRPLELLSTDGRPLSKDLDAVKKLYEERKDYYLSFSDHVVNNDKDLETAVKGVIDLL